MCSPHFFSANDISLLHSRLFFLLFPSILHNHQLLSVIRCNQWSFTWLPSCLDMGNWYTTGHNHLSERMWYLNQLHQLNHHQLHISCYYPQAKHKGFSYQSVLMIFQCQNRILVKTSPMFKIVCSATNPAQRSNENNSLHIHISACPIRPEKPKKA